MLLRHPRSCCCQPQSSFILFFPRGLISSTSSIPVHISISIPIPIRTYSSPRPSKSQSKAALQRSQPSFVALNPTITTHPPPLNLPEKLPTLPKYRYYFRVGKAYAVFYKTGLKAIWTNYKLARDLPHRIFFSDQIRIHRAVRHGLLSRADLQLIRRTRRDINKVPLFALIWLVCGEFTPLVIIFFTGAVPRTIWIPKQVQKAREEAETRRANSEKASIVLPAGPLRRSDMESMPEEPQRNALKSYAQSLGLYPAFWDRWIPSMIPMSLIKRRVYKRLGELEVDDFAIQRDGGVGKMEDEEVRMACEERGIDILAKEEKHLRRDLEQWMERRAEKTDERIRRSTGTGK